MGRPRIVDRAHLLSVAQEIVSSGGAAALTFGGMAQLAGLSKGTIQSVFGTREKLIDALLEHWLQDEQQRFDEAAGDQPQPRDRIRAHIQTTAQETVETGSRMAGLLAALASSGHQAGSAARWYASRVGDFTARTPEERRLRIAFLAAEGAFFVRHLAGIEMTDALWRDIFTDLQAFEAGELE